MLGQLLYPVDVGLHALLVFAESSGDDPLFPVGHRFDGWCEARGCRSDLHPLGEDDAFVGRLNRESPCGRRVVGFANAPRKCFVKRELGDRARGLPGANRRMAIAADERCAESWAGVDPLGSLELGREPSGEVDVGDEGPHGFDRCTYDRCRRSGWSVDIAHQFEPVVGRTSSGRRPLGQLCCVTQLKDTRRCTGQ